MNPPISLLLSPKSGTPPKLELGTAESFAILAYSGVTVSGAADSTTVYGDIGSYPINSYTGSENVVQTGGDVYLAEGVALQAQLDLQDAYDDAERRVTTRNITDLDLGTISSVEAPLYPGVYTADDSLGLTENNTLYLYADNPNDAFIFQIGSTLITGSASSIVLLGEATFCQVFWQVGSSATLGSDSLFVGHILANISIGVGPGTTVIGQLLALNGAVTLDGSNTITNDPCKANINAPADGYDETLIVTVGTDNSNGNGNGNGTDNRNGNGNGTDNGAGDDTMVLGSMMGSETGSVAGSETIGDSDILSDDILALPATGGLALAQTLYALGGLMMAVGGILLKRKVR